MPLHPVPNSHFNVSVAYDLKVELQTPCLHSVCGYMRSEHMRHQVAIRREDKNIWERRVPLTPRQTGVLAEEFGVRTVVQSSPIRVFPDATYAKAGAAVREDISDCRVVFAIKEIPADLFQPRTTYVFFSHTAKGQAHNMPMLRRLVELKCTLIDYEKIVDEKGRRLVFFGNYAGTAGMLDSLWALGQRLEWEGVSNPFSVLKKTHEYHDLKAAKTAVEEVGNVIASKGLPAKLCPFVCGFSGYGNVYGGARVIFDLLPHKEIAPSELPAIAEGADRERKTLYKVVFKEEHSVEPIERGARFDLQDYYAYPEKYRSRFETYVPHLTALVNCVYWERRYPRLITKEYVRKSFAGRSAPRLRVIGDVSCDVNGSIECTLRTTDPAEPVFVYDPDTDSATLGFRGRGLVIMAVDNLPCELPKESSQTFGEQLVPFVALIANADYDMPFETCGLPPVIKDATLLYNGNFTPKYSYMAKFLS